MPGPTLLALLAAVAALVAAGERRHRDMALAAGIAASLAPAGWVVLPVLAGTAIARRLTLPCALLSASAAITTVLVVGAPPAPAMPLTWQLLGWDLSGLVAAAATGVAAWTAAATSARSPRPREITALALVSSLALTPALGVAPLALAALLLAAGARLSDLPRPAANDAPPTTRRCRSAPSRARSARRAACARIAPDPRPAANGLALPS